MACLVPCDEGLDVLPVDEHLPAYLDEGQAAGPDLRTPEPFGSAELIDQFFDGEEPFPRGCLILGCRHVCCSLD